MPAKSKSQQHLMGMALSVKRGEKKLSELPEGVRDEVRSLLRSMSDKQLREFASTKTSSLPERAQPRRTRKVRTS